MESSTHNFKETAIIATYTHQLPTWAITALFYGDLSGINDIEERQLKSFENRLADLVNHEKGNHYILDIPEGNETYFRRSNDVDYMAGDVVDCDVHIFGNVDIVESWVPHFPGFYCTVYEADDECIDDSLKYDLAEHYGYNMELIDDMYELYELDYKGYQEKVGRMFVDVIQEKIDDIFKGSLKMEFEAIESPGYYNFSNDGINARFILKGDFYQIIRDYLNEHESAFSQYLRDKYTSRSGFISHYSNDLEVWKEEYTDFYTSFGEHELGSIIGFILANEYDLDDLPGEVLNDIHVGEFVEIKVPPFDSLPEEVSSQLKEIELTLEEGEEKLQQYSKIKPEFAGKARNDFRNCKMALKKEYTELLRSVVE